jgi:2-furoyl-CoA dehydrogenase 2Fe-2S iron sulfur subunit
VKRYERAAHHRVAFTLNGAPRSGSCEPRLLLSDFLREQMGATGVHVGCEHGICGACTVRIDGLAVRSCLTLAVQVDGCRVDTVEGLAGGVEGLGDLQEAFRRNHALQCGFCTPGILMSCQAYLDREHDVTEQGVREMLSAHLCRCTGYSTIVRAVLEVAAGRRGPGRS